MRKKEESIAERIARRKATVEQMVETEEEILPATGTSPEPGTDEVAATGTGECMQPGTPPGTPPPPSPDTVTGTGTSPLIKPTEVYIRKVGYFLEHQSKFIVKKAKQYKVKEAEIMRIAIEELIKSGKI